MNNFLSMNSIFITSLGFTFILSLFPFFLYRLTNPTSNRDTHFEFSLIFTTPVVFLIMFFIGTNIALSIGLVGSLSVIRFRTAIKSPKDLIYLLFAISIGVGLGSQNLKLVILSTILLSIFIFIIEKIFLRSSNDMFSFINIEVSSENNNKVIQDILSNTKLEIVSISNKETLTILNMKSKGGTEVNYEVYKKLCLIPEVQNVQVFNN